MDQNKVDKATALVGKVVEYTQGRGKSRQTVVESKGEYVYLQNGAHRHVDVVTVIAA